MASGQWRKNLVMTAMIFAVAMTSINQTIVSIAAPPTSRTEA
jgi:hypothetical protein